MAPRFHVSPERASLNGQFTRTATLVPLFREPATENLPLKLPSG
jgi:hypothetical protein